MDLSESIKELLWS